MKLQIAVDVNDEEKVLEIADEVHDIVDIFEVGTPTIIKYGVQLVKKIKERYPEMIILADTKIMDGGAIECRDACEMGADIVTVLAVSDNATVKEVIHEAHEQGKQVLVDLMCIQDISSRSRELMNLGADYICVHTGVDQQQGGRTPLRDLMELVGAIDPSRAAVAGGVRMDTVDSYKALRPGIIVAGGGLYNAEDIRTAAKEMKEVIG